MNRRAPGSSVRPRTVTDASGVEHPFPAREGSTHLQVRRFAGCPICGEHLAPFVDRADELDAAGVTEVVVFKSDAAHVRRHESHLPFLTLPDPDGRWYAELGVRSTITSLLHPRAVLAFLRGVVRTRSLGGSLSLGDHLGLPADLLLEPDGTVVDACYGTDASDGWSVDQVLARTVSSRT